MKFLGAVLILSGCLSLSAGICRRRWKRIRLLRELARALFVMEGELKGNLTPLPRLIQMLSSEYARECASFFARMAERLSFLGDEPFSALWADAAEQTLKELSPREREIVRALGETLGRYPLPMQLTALSRCREYLLESERAERQRYMDERRLIWGTAAAAAMLLWIILI